MCSHQYNFNLPSQEIKCEWGELYSSKISQLKESHNVHYVDLPTDTDGKCIFHSTDIEWKRENNFFERFLDLINLLNSLDNIEFIRFIDVHFVGFLTEEYKKEIHSDADFSGINNNENKYSLDLSHQICSKELLLYDSIFHDSIEIDRCCFKKGITIENTQFKKNVEIHRTTFGDDVNITDNTIFSGNAIWGNYNVFYGKNALINCTFERRSDFDNVHFISSIDIEQCKFTSKEEYTNFSCYFYKGIGFRNNSFNSLLIFSDCNFFSDNLFYNNTQNSEFHLENPVIAGNLSFVGEEDNLLFNPHTILEISPNSFDDNGHVTFDYCNILNLNNDFIHTCQDLENQQLITINPTCKVERLTIVYEYKPYLRVTSNIIEDFVNVISRFFDSEYSIELKVSIIRDTKNLTIKVIFKTSDNITDQDFKKKLGLFPSMLKTKERNLDENSQDMLTSIRSIYKRLLLLKDKGTINEGTISSILSLKGDINLENYITIMADEIKIENSQIGNLITGGEQIIEGSTFKQKNTFSEGLDYIKLGLELSKLKTELKNKAETTEHFETIEIIEEAEDALKKKENKKAIQKLKQLGTWGVNTAQEISVNIISGIINGQLGL